MEETDTHLTPTWLLPFLYVHSHCLQKWLYLVQKRCKNRQEGQFNDIYHMPEVSTVTPSLEIAENYYVFLPALPQLRNYRKQMQRVDL